MEDQYKFSRNGFEWSKLLKKRKNVILQGAPGTGKTYSTAEVALLTLGKNCDYSNHEKVMETYHEAVKLRKFSSQHFTSRWIMKISLKV